MWLQSGVSPVRKALRVSQTKPLRTPGRDYLHVAENLPVRAVRYTKRNQAKVAAWTDGLLLETGEDNLIVPLEQGRPLNVRIGDWVVLEDGDWKCVGNEEFNKQYRRAG